MEHDLPTLDQPVHSQDSNRGRFVIDTLFRHWVLILVVGVIGAVAGGAIGTLMYQVRHEYWATTDLVVKKSFWQVPALANLGPNIFGDVTPRGLLNQLDTNALARDVTEALVQDDIANGKLGGGLTSDEEINQRANQLMGNIVLEPHDEKGIIRLRVRSAMGSDDAVRTADFAARGMVEYTQLQRADQQQQAYDLLQEQLNELRVELDTAEGAQWDYREQMGFRSHERVWSDIESKNGQLLEAVTMNEQIHAKLRGIDEQLMANGRALPDALGNVTEAVVLDLLRDLDELRQEELELSVVWKPGYPELDLVKDDIAEKKEAVLIAIDELNGGAGGSSMWQQRQDLYRQKVGLNSQLTTLEVRAATLEKVLAEMVAGLPDLADKTFEYDQLSHESAHIRGQFDRLLEREFELRTALGRGMATVDRRNAAMALPVSVSGGAQWPATTALGLGIGIALAFGYAMLREMNDTSIKSTNELRQYIQLEDIGTIPDMRSRRGRYARSRKRGSLDPAVECIVTQHDPKSPVSEAYRSLRTNFQFATLKQAPKTIMVTSSLPGEGKTTTTVNFAVTMSDLGKRVLIIDTDLRRPNVHKTLSMERGLGLADILQDQVAVADVIRPTPSENLYMISSGRVPPNPSELIGGEKMASLMKELSGQFDVIICDAPSTLVVTDPVLLATHVDSIILVVSVGRTRRETVLRAKKIIETANPNIAGAVLNGLKATSRHYYYYYYYYDERSRRGRRPRPPRGGKLAPAGGNIPGGPDETP